MQCGRRSVKLEDICAQITDGKHGDCQDEGNSGFYFLSCKDVFNGKLNYESARQITEADFIETHRRTKLEPADILITNSGTIGRMAIAPDNDLTRRTTFQKSVAILKPIPTQVEPSFLYYLLRSDLRRLTDFAGGTAQKNLLLRDLRDFSVELPPLPVQHRIASTLSAYDHLIENNQRRIKILEEMARSLYREWFVNFRFPGHEKVPLVDSPLGPIPKGWEVKKLKDLCSKLIDGTHDSPKPSHSGYPLVTGRHIRNGFIEFSDTYLISEDEHRKVMKRSRPEKGDIIYSNIGTLGEATIVDQNFEYSIKNVALFKPISRSHSPFLYCYLVDPDSLQTLMNKASGTSQKFFSLDFLRNIDIAAPPEGIICLFAEKLFPILEFRSLLHKRNETLRRTRDLLLPRLLTGSLILEPRGS
jgi:type I restriction enzyme, S subunit